MKYFSLSTASILSSTLALTLSLFLASCSSSKKLVTAAPSIPFHIPDTLPALPVSEIDLPLKVCIRPLLARADSIMPKNFTSYAWPAYTQPSCDFRYKYHFVRSAFTLNCSNNLLNLQLTCSYQVAGSRCICALGKPVSPWLSGTCGFGNESMRRVDIGISSQIDFLPDYRIRTRTRTGQLKALDKCIVSMFSQDMTQQIVDSVQVSIDALCSIIDQNVAHLNFSPWLRQATAMAGQGIPMGHYGYMIINPLQIRIGQLTQTGDSLAISVGLSCKPLLTSDSSRRPVIPLPPLTRSANRDGLFLYLQAAYDYAFIIKLLNDTLRNRSFTVKGNTITVRDIGLKEIGNHQLEMKIDFTGDRKGRIYLRGTPVLDSAKQTLSLPDVSYSLESKDLALKIARSLLRGKIRRSLQGNSYLDIAALIKANLPALNAQLNKQLPGVAFSSGKVREIRVLGLLASERTLQVQFFVNANLSIINTGLPK